MLRKNLFIGLACLIGTCFMSACTTTKSVKQQTPPHTTSPGSTSPGSTSPVLIPTPRPAPAPSPYQPSPQPLPPSEPSRPQQPTPSTPQAPSSNAAFNQLSNWKRSDARPALNAFRRNCSVWNGQDPFKAFSPNHPEFGVLSDWQSLCRFARQAGDKNKDAKSFFETHFYPLILPVTGSASTFGLLTGYYQPEVEVRAAPVGEFTEPILAVPARASDRLRPRSTISANIARVMAYGRPMDVFFMQIQGSGVLAFDNGYRVRAAYAANNGMAYTSIGGVLVRRGEMTKEQASKQAIEAWMTENGSSAARALMNENKRYIFFAEETLVPGEGPMGAMAAPLTAMGSLAVDPKHHPYGLPIWLNVKLPQSGGDYRGKEQGQLVIAQDTGKAIRGPQRGDIYFGAGYEAGAKAGVMKHKGKWAILMPRSLIRLVPIT